MPEQIVSLDSFRKKNSLKASNISFEILSLKNRIIQYVKEGGEIYYNDRSKNKIWQGVATDFSYDKATDVMVVMVVSKFWPEDIGTQWEIDYPLERIVLVKYNSESNFREKSGRLYLPIESLFNLRGG